MINPEGSLRSFRHRNFRILFPANAASNIGNWAQRVAQDWLVLQLTHSGRDLGLVTGLQFLPALLLSLYGGRLADRFNKRTLLYITNLGGGISALVLGLLVMTNTVHIWHVYVLAFALGIFAAIDAPIRQSFTSEMVGKSDLANAVSLNSANFNAGRLIGPGVSGLLIAWFGTGPSFIINACSYIAVVIALSAIRESELHIESAPQSDAKIREAWAYVRKRTDIFAVMVTVFFAATFGLNFQVFTALMATAVFYKGPASFGGLGSIVAIGSLSGALMSAKLMLTLPIAGALGLTTMIAANSYVQTKTDPALRGRVMGIYLTIFLGGTPVGSPLIGWLSESIGTRQTIFICGLVTMASSGLIYALLRDKLFASNQN